MATEKEKKTRASLEVFLSVVLEAKDKQDAANKLGLTESSFDQRLRRERGRYKEMFETIDTSKFFTGRVGRKPETKEEAWATLAKIKGVNVEDLKPKVQEEKKEEVTAEHTAKPKRSRTSKK